MEKPGEMVYTPFLSKVNSSFCFHMEMNEWFKMHYVYVKCEICSEISFEWKTLGSSFILTVKGWENFNFEKGLL